MALLGYLYPASNTTRYTISLYLWQGWQTWGTPNGHELVLIPCPVGLCIPVRCRMSASTHPQLIASQPLAVSLLKPSPNPAAESSTDESYSEPNHGWVFFNPGFLLQGIAVGDGTGTREGKVLDGGAVTVAEHRFGLQKSQDSSSASPAGSSQAEGDLKDPSLRRSWGAKGLSGRNLPILSEQVAKLLLPLSPGAPSYLPITEASGARSWCSSLPNEGLTLIPPA